MNILDKIILDKRKEIAFKKESIPLKTLEQSPMFDRIPNSMTAMLIKSSTGIIAEYKRKSPSKSDINLTANVNDVVKGYTEAGVCGISVLTDEKYFGGTLIDLRIAKANTTTPLLRKDFIVDEFQIIEAKANGADTILLIAAVLTRSEIKRYSELAKSLGLDVLLEVHNEEELQKSLMPSIDMLGVNNRNLKTFNVDTQTSKDLSLLIPNDFVKVSESGISNINIIKDLQTYGYRGFLIGENFMKTDNPGTSAITFIESLQNLAI